MTNKNSNEEKRRFKRVKTMKKVKAVISQDELDALLHDISGGGAALGVEYEVLPDDNIEINIEGVGLIRGEVVRPIDIGMAVRFLDIDVDKEKNLHSYIDKMSTENIK